MATFVFDTHRAVKDLAAAGFPEAQAEALVELVGAAVGENAATKADLDAMEQRATAQFVAHNRRMTAHKAAHERRMAAYKAAHNRQMMAYKATHERRMAAHNRRMMAYKATHERRMAAHNRRMMAYKATHERRMAAHNRQMMAYKAAHKRQMAALEAPEQLTDDWWIQRMNARFDAFERRITIKFAAVLLSTFGLFYAAMRFIPG